MIIYFVFRQTDVDKTEYRFIDQKVELSLAEHYICFFLVIKYNKICLTITAIDAENLIYWS